MITLKNNEELFEHDTFMESYLKKEEPDCILYSQDGKQFNIHKEILYQTQLMKNILLGHHSVCCQNIEIFCPCSNKEIESVLNFLYNGTISLENETDVAELDEILTKIFAFPENLFSFEDPTAIKVENEEFKMSEEYFEYEVEDWSDDEIVVISDEGKKSNKNYTTPMSNR